MSNGGPVQEAGKAVGGFIDALKSQPVVLGLIVVIFVLIGLLFYLSYQSSQFRRLELQTIFESQREISKLLANCPSSQNAPDMGSR
jgi:hypothetical protein